MASRPTPRQLQVLRLVADAIARDSYPPTTRELCKSLGITSTEGMHGHIRALVRRGAMTKQDIVSRGIGVTHFGYALLGRDPPASCTPARPSRVVKVETGRRCQACGAMRFVFSIRCFMCAVIRREKAA